GQQLSQEVHGVLLLLGEGCSSPSRLTGDARPERRHDTTSTGRVAMLRRQVSRHDAPERLASSPALGHALPDVLGPGQGAADRLGRERLLGIELTVEGAMGQTGTLAYRVDAGGADAVLPEQARGRGQDLLPILRRLLLRDLHPWLLARSDPPLTWRGATGHEPDS